ncbi:MAG: YggS family pyridoxal phosphate-dependent enzyme [Caldisericaceae bacterium]|nr:YggS family pyridoxal phosphate-dependent enzyme [Caldisericaceae bacterium]
MIKKNVQKILQEIPQDVLLVAAVKSRSTYEIKEAVDAGVKIIGENYLQETEKLFPCIERIVKWHYIGSIQKNKIKKIVKIFDMIETVDSVDVLREIDKRAKGADKIMPVLIEVNSAREGQKSGVYPEQVEQLIDSAVPFRNVLIQGLMTMGPFVDDPEKLRPYFKLTKELFDYLKAYETENIQMKYLSMGMSDSYKIAIQEGANIVRIGTLIFGQRHNR